VKKALVGLNDDDTCFVGDLDEIWNPNIKFNLDECDIYRPELTPYLYYFNLRSDANLNMFTGTIITKYKTIKNNCLNHLKNKNGNDFKWIENGGWHFEAFGGAEEKINTVKHYDYSFMIGKDKDLTKLKKDYKKRNINTWVCEDNLPTFVIDNKLDMLKYFVYDFK
jgi:hypothetical protein